MLEAARRWDLVHRGAAITRRGRPYAGGIWLGGGGKDGGDGGVRRWDLLLRMQSARR